MTLTIETLCGDAKARFVHRLQHQDAIACEQLVNEHWSRLVGLARSILGCDQEAQDAAQTGLISAIQRIGDLADAQALEGWLNRIVANAALARLRSRKSRRERAIEDLLPQFQADGHRSNVRGDWAVTAGSRMESEEMRTLVRSKIEELPEVYREVIMLRDIIGMDTKATAAALGIEVNNVKVRLHRARQALRTLLEGSMEA